MEREELIEEIIELIKNKRIEHLKYYTLLPIKYYIVSIASITIYFIGKWLSMNYLGDILSYNLHVIVYALYFSGLCIAIGTFWYANRYIYYICTVKILKIKIFDIEEHLSELSDDDISILKNKLKRLHWRGEMFCLKDSIILSNKNECLCAQFESLESIRIVCSYGEVACVSCVYKQDKYNQTKDKNHIKTISIGRVLYEKLVPQGLDVLKMQKENAVFRELSTHF